MLSFPRSQSDWLCQGHAQLPTETVLDYETPANCGAARCCSGCATLQYCAGPRRDRRTTVIQARIPEFAIEALHQGVLTRLPRLDKPEPVRPEEQGLAGELWPVIQHNGLWTAPIESQVIQKPGVRKVHELADAFPAVIVHDVQNAYDPWLTDPT